MNRTCLRHGFGHLGLHLFAGFRGKFLANLFFFCCVRSGVFLRKFLENFCRRCFVGFVSSEWGIFCEKKFLQTLSGNWGR